MGQTEFYRALGPEQGTWFDETNWLLVRQAGQPELAQADAARANLCQTYWRPIYCYIRRLGHGHEDAQDLTQEFFVRVLEHNYVQAAASDKGKFRSYLLMMLKRFLADQWDRARRQKRGGGQTLVSLDEGDTETRSRREPADPLTPDKWFDRAWAESLLEKTLGLLEQECHCAGKQRLFLEVKPCLTCESEEPCAATAERLGMTAGNLKVTIHRLRLRLRELLRHELARTARTPEEVEEEWQDLHAVLSEPLHPQ